MESFQILIGIEKRKCYLQEGITRSKMLRQLLTNIRPKTGMILRHHRLISNNSADNSSKDEKSFKRDLGLTGVHLDDLDEIMSNEAPGPIDSHYPNIDVDQTQTRKPLDGHSVVVVQPWVSYATFGELTDPELQLEECVSLGNTIHNWNVVGKKIVLAHSLNRKHIVGPQAFEELKGLIFGFSEASAVFFGVELLSGIQLLTLEKELGMPVYDRFTVVLNIFRQHARTREAKLQLALAELPYIRSHLRGIHESSEDASSTGALKYLVGGSGERHYHLRIDLLRRRESKLKTLLEQVQKQRNVIKKKNKDIPLVSVIGYTNSGKTTVVKYLTQDERLVPLNQLFATLDVTSHYGQLPSTKNVMYLDTVGFLSRIPTLLIDAFSTTLKDIQESDLLIHVLDVTHPDHKIQHETVIKALERLQVSKNLMTTTLTIGNKIDLVERDEGGVPLKELPGCDLYISATAGTNLQSFVEKIDHRLKANLKHDDLRLRVDNGGREYGWLKKNGTMVECIPDENDVNYLICRVIMSPADVGRWSKYFGTKSILPEADTVKA